MKNLSFFKLLKSISDTYLQSYVNIREHENVFNDLEINMYTVLFLLNHVNRDRTYRNYQSHIRKLFQ